MEEATGLMTGSIYGSEVLHEDFYGENRFDDGSTIVQKTHHRSLLQRRYDTFDLEWRRHHMNLFGNRGILLIRDPYRALISYWHLIQTKEHTGTKDLRNQSLKLDSSFDSHVRRGADRWLELILDWAEHCAKCHLVYFEVEIEYCQAQSPNTKYQILKFNNLDNKITT